MNKKKFNRSIENLNKLYRKIPETQGCIKYTSIDKKDGGCGAWCCIYQNPSLLKVEFLNAWNFILKNWELDLIVELIKKAIETYVTDIPTKGCILFDRENLRCKIHEKRSLACRMYGITPEEEFKPKYEQLKILYKDHPLAVVKDQCSLVETVNGRKVTKEMSDEWWNELKNVEISIGIPNIMISDQMGGTYRSYHDHILLHLFPDDIMSQLQTLRLYGNHQEKDIAIKAFMDKVKLSLKDFLNGQKPGNTNKSS